jgi:hypothetical protein
LVLAVNREGRTAIGEAWPTTAGRYWEVLLNQAFESPFPIVADRIDEKVRKGGDT